MPTARLSSSTLQALQTSLDRCLDSPQFFDDFYRRFLGASPHVRALFASVDLAQHRALLAPGLTHLLQYASGAPHAARSIELFSKLHGSRQLAVAPGLYGVWRDALLATIEQHDRDFRPALRRYWREVLDHGIAALREVDEG